MGNQPVHHRLNNVKKGCQYLQITNVQVLSTIKCSIFYVVRQPERKGIYMVTSTKNPSLSAPGALAQRRTASGPQNGRKQNQTL